jgi:hypothetical protein
VNAPISSRAAAADTGTMDHPPSPWSDLPPPPPWVPDQRPRSGGSVRIPGPGSPARGAAFAVAAGILVAAGLWFALAASIDPVDRPAEPTRTEAPSSPAPASDLERLTVRREGAPAGFPSGWHRWRSSDGSFSFVVPPGSHTEGPVYRDDLWELSFEGHVVHGYVYVSDRYRIGADPTPFLNWIADGLVDDGTELHRSEIRQQGWPGLEVVYRDDLDQYLFVNRVFVIQGHYVQVSAGYAELLDGRERRREAATFLDSFRLHGRPVAGAS